jgi:hypothetical protein
LSGTASEIDFDSSGELKIVSHPCNSHLGGSVGVCISAGSGVNVTTLSLLLDGSNIDIEGFHIIGPACGTEQTCFTTGTSVVPEPGTLGLLGTGLIGIAGLVRRRFVS